MGTLAKVNATVNRWSTQPFDASTHFRPPLSIRHINARHKPGFMQYVIQNLEDHEIGRANDARSAWAIIDAQWPGAATCILGGPWFLGWMQLSVHLPAGGALIIKNGKTVGGVTIGEE